VSVVVPEKEQRVFTLRRRSFDSDVSSPTALGPTECRDPDRYGRACGKPLFDLIAQACAFTCFHRIRPRPAKVSQGLQ
jgi:hypothetical protein